ncbi:MAG: hypothetical protein R3E83_13300 [Burkholderiaceae bacterium]
MTSFFLAGARPTTYVANRPATYTDPDGQFMVLSAIFSALADGGLQVYHNYRKNGGDIVSAIRCIDVTDVAGSFVVGGILPGYFKIGYSLLRLKPEFVSNAGKTLLIGSPSKFGITEALPDFRPLDPNGPELTYDRPPAEPPEVIRRIFF